MNLSDLAKKPELVEIVIDDADIVEQYKEPITFYTFDRCPLDTFTKLAGLNQSNPSEMIHVVKDLILDKDQRPILSKDRMLPPAVLIRAVQKIVAKLGN